MRFTPKTEEEIRQINLFKDGDYPYEVIYAEDTHVKNGKNIGVEQIKLKIKAFNEEGRQTIIECYLSELMIHLLKHYCDVNNKTERYNSNELFANECLSDSGGLVRLGIEKGKPIPNDPDNKCWPDRNVVKDFVHDKNHAKIQVNTSKEFLNDDIPF